MKNGQDVTIKWEVLLGATDRVNIPCLIDDNRLCLFNKTFIAGAHSFKFSFFLIFHTNDQCQHMISLIMNMLRKDIYFRHILLSSQNNFQPCVTNNSQTMLCLELLIARSSFIEKSKLKMKFEFLSI